MPCTQHPEGVLIRPWLLAVLACALLLALLAAARGAGAHCSAQVTWRGAAPPAAALARPRACPTPALFDFVEIGTSDFATLLEDAVKAEAADGIPRRGLSVDAMRIYLEGLPVRAGLTKVNAAILGFAPHPPTIPVFFISPQNIVGLHLPEWLRGCNSVGKPHPQADPANYAPGVVESENVTLLSVGELLVAQGVCRTRRLKVDVEGVDANVLVGFADFLWRHPACHADEVVFEKVHDPAAHVKGALKALATVGYAWCGSAGDAGGGEDDVVLCYSEGNDARRFWAPRARANATLSEAAMAAVLDSGDGVAFFNATPEYGALVEALPATDCFWA